MTQPAEITQFIFGQPLSAAEQEGPSVVIYVTCGIARNLDFTRRGKCLERGRKL